MLIRALHPVSECRQTPTRCASFVRLGRNVGKHVIAMRAGLAGLAGPSSVIKPASAFIINCNLSTALADVAGRFYTLHN
jgi:hypothetical protein